MIDDVAIGTSRSVVLERVAYDAASWERELGGYRDAEVFHSPAWLAFLSASQGAEPVLAVVRERGRPVGHFVGAIVRRFGVRILGSPLRGWGTESMAFLLEEPLLREAAAQALLPFAFRDLGCLHVELTDRHLAGEDLARSGYVVEPGWTFVADLTPPEEAILGNMQSRARTYVQRAARGGLRVEAETEPGFAAEYHDQLTDVFASQGIAPTYPEQRVRTLIDVLQPTGQLLLLRVRAPDGRSIASAVVVGRNETAVLWGSAFYRSDRALHPNEILHWEVMRRWKARGALRYDMGGAGDYKRRYGAVRTPTAHAYRSRYAVLRHGRAAVRRLVATRQVAAGLPRRVAGR
jgi:hypothetical protein